MSRTRITYDPIPETLHKSARNAFTLGLLGNSAPDLSLIYDLRVLNDVLEQRGVQAVYQAGR